MLLAGAEAPTPWGNGTQIFYLGTKLLLQLSSHFQETTLVDHVLHLPLPPNASERQIQDRAESWLRASADTLLSEITARHTLRLNRIPPRCRLSFGARANWVVVDGADLRCNWRLIEHPPEIIEQLLVKALNALAATDPPPDLFSSLAA